MNKRIKLLRPGNVLKYHTTGKLNKANKNNLGSSSLSSNSANTTTTDSSKYSRFKTKKKGIKIDANLIMFICKFSFIYCYFQASTLFLLTFNCLIKKFI